MSLEDSDGFSGLDEECFIVFEFKQGANDCIETVPVPNRSTRAAVYDEFVGLFAAVRIEIVAQHPESRFLLPSFAVKPRSTGSPHCSSFAAADLQILDQALPARCVHVMHLLFISRSACSNASMLLYLRAVDPIEKGFLLHISPESSVG
jgi:hypothetical protein